ncbi:unnamed protein product [Kuraishia capsulata CBS 1993]|uniref:non-specific serine/threonine protein kinase n=1 Tax=Kuraishia capsulata CBS 1993 TaxID=1382522 RepID=W6MR45_9ASCO|nr:uncharacterized protein KUCA_T00004813001 [Kuraishia capsulata CBS 1993]CDK28828.1 unnamed protein product [Kuraishia capsulata CBS 1993]
MEPTTRSQPVSSLTRLINQQKKESHAPGLVIDTGTAPAAPAEYPPNGTITTTISIEGASPDDEQSAFGSSTSLSQTVESYRPIHYQPVLNRQSSSPLSPFAKTSSRSNSVVSLSSSIPYSAPGGRSLVQGTSGINSAGSNGLNQASIPVSQHMPNLPNGNVISSINISSPTVANAGTIEPRFIISKQKVAATQASQSSFSALHQGGQANISRSNSHSSLGGIFSKSRRGTVTGFDGVPIPSTSVISQPISASPNSPSSHSSTESASQFQSRPSVTPNARHSSMADLRRFFRRSVSGASPRTVTQSNLSAGIVNSARNSPAMSPMQSNSSIHASSVVSTPGESASVVGHANGSFNSRTASGRGVPLPSPSLPKTGTSFSNVKGYAPSPVATSGSLSASQSSLPFSKRYGKYGENLGAGAGGTVRLVKRVSDLQIFAVKEFRPKYTHETKRDYTKKITSEYCIGSTLRHPNIIETVEICYENDRIVQVMEYCDFDLFAIVMSGKMSISETNCCFKQILNGVLYLHSLGLAHRDLKLDNCVVSKDGIVKIIDFGSAVVFSYPFSSTLVEAHGIVGSDPYLAPEVCVFSKYDPRPVDIWSAAIIYCCMMLKKFPWKVPKLTDPSFKMFATRDETLGEILKRTPSPPAYSDFTTNEQSVSPSTKSHALREYEDLKKALPEETPATTPATTGTTGTKDSGEEGKAHTSGLKGEERLLNALPQECRPLIGRMVELAPACRITIDDCFKDSWLESVQMCHMIDDGEFGDKLIPSTDHEHTIVDQSVAHIASLEKNKNKKKR